ncbi:hypothetical protein [Streptomyces sp. 2P-4]|uniref:hypothetical protein n=1 Tax=Streptomyces sp. 2P-4 TaxID=2931974 RepID=UPI002541BA8E|nr:hypothetical protein [Streptomyces sp. 2P-4]
MSDTTEDEAPEEVSTEGEQPFRVRDVFQFRRQPKQAPEPEPQERTAEGLPIPPKPTDDPIVIPQVSKEPAALRVGDRAPNWWEPKPIISADDPPPRDTIVWRNGRPYDVPAPAPKMCDHPEPHAVRSRPDNRLVAFWCADCETQLPVPDDFDELDDETAEDDGDGEQADGDPVPEKVRRRWGLRGNGTKDYNRPAYAKKVEKQSLVDWWNGRDRRTAWLLYNGTALAAGFSIGVPQFFTAEVAYLAATYDSWTDFYVCVWYGVAAGIWVWDHRSRTWFPPFALAARIPLISMVVGSLLYGTADLTV